jgi:histidine triad (HIT) family protein
MRLWYSPKEEGIVDCVFCRIVAGELPAYKIYEDDRVYAFLDAARDVDGHTLVVPKRHCRNILDCDPAELAAVARGVQTVSRHYVNDAGYDGANVFSLTEPSAGQSVFHLHFHIFPRKNGDGVYDFPKLRACRHSLEEMHEKLKIG